MATCQPGFPPASQRRGGLRRSPGPIRGCHARVQLRPRDGWEMLACFEPEGLFVYLCAGESTQFLVIQHGRRGQPSESAVELHLPAGQKH